MGSSINKFSKNQINIKLNISMTWSRDQILNHIKKEFKYWNSKTNSKDNKIVKEAEEMLEYCAAALIYYKPEPHVRKYKKTIKKNVVSNSSKISRKRAPLHSDSFDYKTTNVTNQSSNTGCAIIFILIIVSYFLTFLTF